MSDHVSEEAPPNTHFGEPHEYSNPHVECWKCRQSFECNEDFVRAAVTSEVLRVLDELDIRDDVDTDNKAAVAYGALVTRNKRIRNRYTK